MRKVVVTLLVLFCFLLQCSVFPYIKIAGIIPNLLIILTSSFGFMRGEKEGLVIGFFGGFLCDVFFGDFLGFYALLLMYLGFLNGKFSRIFYPEDIKLPLALIVTSDLTYSTLLYIILLLLRGRIEFSYYFVHIILPEVLYTTVVTLFLYPFLLRVNVRLEEWEKRRAQKFV